MQKGAQPLIMKKGLEAHKVRWQQSIETFLLVQGLYGR